MTAYPQRKERFMSQIDRKKDHVQVDTRAPATGSTAVDPVCGMTVTLEPDTRTERFFGKVFHFCSEKCQTTFKADPSSYASGDPERPDKAAPANAQYTCPMHP
jgi:Cu+-exporting ATPase